MSFYYIYKFVEITIIDNKQGLEKINHTMESKSVYSSIGIVERALNQMEEYDFFVPIVITINYFLA